MGNEVGRRAVSRSRSGISSLLLAPAPPTENVYSLSKSTHLKHSSNILEIGESRWKGLIMAIATYLDIGEGKSTPRRRQNGCRCLILQRILPNITLR